MQINLNKQIYLLRKNIMRTFGFITAGVFVLAWLFFPNLFQWWAIHVWSIPADQLNEMGKLGPLGDIYGSLNTLFTSATLLIVIYSAYLQRKANKDAIEMMSTQLSQAKKFHKEQLTLAQATYKGQIEETRNAIFANKFYGLLNFKNEKLNHIKVYFKNENGWREINRIETFSELSSIFIDNLRNDPGKFDKKAASEVKKYFDEIVKEKFNNNLSPIISYFYLFADLINLVKNSSIEDEEKDFYMNVLRNNMFQAEQVTLFLISSFYIPFKNAVDSSHIFNQFYDEYLFNFALNFHKESHFFDSWWKEIFIENN
ncbi:hypothetical protein A1E08_RS06040 [Acinetobacter baumannii]|nr:hypothetical protein [Acinetobacter baumannii]